jgi:hypothetical protein
MAIVFRNSQNEAFEFSWNLFSLHFYLLGICFENLQFSDCLAYLFNPVRDIEDRLATDCLVEEVFVHRLDVSRVINPVKSTLAGSICAVCDLVLNKARAFTLFQTTFNTTQTNVSDSAQVVRCCEALSVADIAGWTRQWQGQSLDGTDLPERARGAVLCAVMGIESSLRA